MRPRKMKLTLDFETRSTVDLKKCGAYKYAEALTTDVLCLAVKVDEDEPLLWVPEKFGHMLWGTAPLIDDTYLTKLIETADEIEAHNAGFEYIIWHKIMNGRYGFPPLSNKKVKCSAAQAANFAIPRSLGLACRALRLEEQKDSLGHTIMMKMCKPRAPLKADKMESSDWMLRTYWHENPDEFRILCEYCLQDVNSEEGLSRALYPLSDFEQKVWELDLKINTRGIRVDLEGIKLLRAKVKEKEEELLKETVLLTAGRVSSPKQVAATRAFLKEEGVELEDLQKGTVAKALKGQMPKRARRLLEIRQILGKSSVAKLDAMERMACNDHRVRGIFLYAGARTKRWAGRGIQPQNLPRDTYDDKDIELILSTPNRMIEIIYGDVMETASKCLRGMLMADSGKQLFVADFASIEARVLAWIAGETDILEAYRKGLDIYKLNAVNIFGAKYESVTKDQRFVGKVAELSLGYQGHIGAFSAMVEAYGAEIGKQEARSIITTWRNLRGRTVAFWRGVEEAAIAAIKTKEVQTYGSIKFGVRGNFLHCRLPSGCLLSYAFPSTMVQATPYGVKKEIVTFWGVGSDNDKMIKGNKMWGMIGTYGGKLTENIVQALSRDLLAEAMLRLETAGYPIVAHVHDEIICELPTSTDKTLKEFVNIMAARPDWALSIPLGAEGYISKRYRK